jgi:hypothetical protein
VPKMLFKFSEVIELLSKYSNHENEMCFIRGEDKIYRHKGYLYLEDGNSEFCMDSSEEYEWELIENEYTKKIIG